MVIDVPAPMLADLLHGRPGATARATAYLMAVAHLQAGSPITGNDLAAATGIGRNAAYALIQQAREALQGTTPGRARDGAGTCAPFQTYVSREPEGRPRDDAGTSEGSAAAPGRARDGAGTCAPFQTYVSREPEGRPRDDAGKPVQLISDLRDLSLQEDRENDQRPPAPSAPLFPSLTTEPATAEGVELLRILRRWSLPPTLPEARWRVKPDEDLAWFTRDILPDAAGLDLCAVLRKWDNWLEGQHREKEAGRKSKFPRTWKNSLRQTLTFAALDRDRRPAGGARSSAPAPQRGAFGATRQRFDIPVHTGHENADEAMDFWRNGHE